MLVDWAGLLERMLRRAGNADVASDIRQLRGLALQQDSQAFLPINPEELAPDSMRRIMGFRRVAENALGMLRGQEGVQGGGFGQWFGGWGYNLTVDTVQCWFGVHADIWVRRADTLFWFQVDENRAASLTSDLRERFRAFRRNGQFCFPIHPRTGVEEEEVVEDMVAQLRAIVQAINSA